MGETMALTNIASADLCGTLFKRPEAGRDFHAKTWPRWINPNLKLLRDEDICFVCQRISERHEQFELDHVVPRSKNGLSVLSNSIVLCKSCNTKKGNRNLGDFAKTMGKEEVLPIIASYLSWIEKEEKREGSEANIYNKKLCRKLRLSGGKNKRLSSQQPPEPEREGFPPLFGYRQEILTIVD